MKKILILSSFVIFSSAAIFSADVKSPAEIKNLEALEGITHYGMPISEIIKKYENNGSLVEIVYSKNLSDDNMDEYIKNFYDVLLRQTEKWLYENKLPYKNMRIVISNCKFCKIGYCKKKNIKELRLVSYNNEKMIKELAIKHSDILDKTKHAEMAQSAVITLLEKR
ncbi:MAG: hypothetical protein KA369_02315 [Spirochaetes bacterium]|nr:hypothetical protein [Spirochaetota bacterium]